MIFSGFQKLVLGLSGVTTLGIGLSILTVPQVFYFGYGIALGNDPSLLSETRAFAAGLSTLGALMLAGLWRTSLGPAAIMAAFTVFLAFPAGRLLGLLLDGLPSGSVIGALVVEMAIGALCLVAFAHRTNGAVTRQAGPAT